MTFIAREFVVAVVCLLLAAGVSLADKKPTKKPADVKKPDGEVKKPTKGDGAPTVIILQLDASKLSPDLLKQLMAAAGGDKKPTVKKPDGDVKKPIKKPDDSKKPDDGKKPDEDPSGKKKGTTLSDAIAIAEKHVKGIAIEAKYQGDGFEVELKTDKGTVKVKMDFSGNVLGDKGKKGDEPGKKGKGKGSK